MGNCFGAQVRAEIPPGATNDPGAASSSKKSRNSIVGTSTQEGGREASDANHGGLLCQPATPAMGGSLRAFSYNDLKAATRNFRPNRLLGKGGSGCVFKGYIDEQTFMPTQPGQGIPIAIKKLNLDRPQEHKEWLAKLHFLGTLHHPNLAKLLGSCAEVDHHRLLVYEFMPRGSLENHLFQKGNHHQTLSWVIRMKIAIDAARGLAFLHNAETPIIYKDLKSSNILLDSQFNAKLSAKLDVLLTKDGATCLSSRVIATGYGAPEYVAIGRLTVKSDVYSFGVVLLEILTGRRVVDGSRPDEEQNLVEWAGPFLSDKRKSLRIMDQKLKGQYSVEGAQKAARVVLHCVKEDAKKRPTMKQVVESLQHLLNAEELSTYNGCNDLNQDGPSLLEAPGHGVVHGVQRDELWQCIDGSSPTMAP